MSSLDSAEETKGNNTEEGQTSQTQDVKEEVKAGSKASGEEAMGSLQSRFLTVSLLGTAPPAGGRAKGPKQSLGLRVADPELGIAGACQCEGRIYRSHDASIVSREWAVFPRF